MTTDVLVLGAGAAGLAAARGLFAAGCHVQVLEARDRVGGRIFTQHDARLAVAVELGAEFVQGMPPRLLEIAHAARLLVCELSGEVFEVDRSSGTLVSARQMRDDSALIFDRLGSLRGRDRPLRELLDAWTQAEPHLAEAARLAARWVEGYDAAHTELISARALAHQARAEAAIRGDRTFRVLGGYDGVINWLRSGLPDDAVQLNAVVTQVNWAPDHVEALTRSGRMFTARRAVVALPLGVLQAGSVRFEPELVDKQRALQNLRMGAVIKLALMFDAPFWWPEGREQLRFLQTPSEPFPVWWTSYPVLSPLLVGWAGGPPAEALSNLADDQIVERALDSLGRVFGFHRRRLASRLMAWCVHNWQCDALALGAYSYVAVGGAGSQRALARPVAGTLVFAGEATEWSGHHATVHGAIMTGERAARELLSAAEADGSPAA